jgi:predicted amidohydrolase YtcJ
VRTIEHECQALLKAEELLIAAGITEVQDAWVDEEILAVYLEAEKSLKLSYHLAFSLTPEKLESDFSFVKRAKESIQNTRIRPHAVKIFVDGVFGSATAAVSRPYLSTQETGQIDWDSQALSDALNFAKENQLQAHLHAIGDAAIEFALDSIEITGTTNAVIAHAELTNDLLIKRAKSLGVTLCVQPYWAQRNDLLLTCSHHLGQERLDSLYSFNSFLKAGVPMAFSSDWPVSSYKPLEGIATAVFRRLNSDQLAHNHAESITTQQALAAYTTGVTSMLDSEPANLEIGSSFSAVVLSGDLMQQDLEGLVSLEVLAVYKDGTRLFPHNND